MKPRKTLPDLSCGLNIAMKVIGAKWKPCIIDAINRSVRRPSELHREIPMATPRVLDMQLSELEVHGIVCKTVYEEATLRSEYELTAIGKSLLPVIETLQKWGDRNRALFGENLVLGRVPLCG